MKLHILLYILSAALFGNAQFSNSYVNQIYSVKGAISGKDVYQYKDTQFFKLHVDTLVVSKLKGGYIKSNSVGELWPIDSIPYGDLKNTPTLATVATTGSYNDLTNKPTIPSALTFTTSAASRSFNSAFQVSTTKDAIVSYTVQIACALTLSGGQSGTVFLETSPDNSVWTEVGRAVNTNTGSLTIGLNITNTNAMTLAGFITRNYYVRLRTTGSGTITYISGQETTF